MSEYHTSKHDTADDRWTKRRPARRRHGLRREALRGTGKTSVRDPFAPELPPELANRFDIVCHLPEGELAPYLDHPEDLIREVAYDRLVALSRRQVDRLLTISGPFEETYS